MITIRNQTLRNIEVTAVLHTKCGLCGHDAKKNVVHWVHSNGVANVDDGYTAHTEVTIRED